MSNAGGMTPPIPVGDGLWMIRKTLPNGWGFNTFVVRLPSGGLLIHTPIDGGEENFKAIEQLGEVRVLFAPNHYHRLSLPSFVARYPNAELLASGAACPRLREKGNPTVKPWTDSAAVKGLQIFDVPGLKNGESWILADGTLIVCDAFFNWLKSVRGVVGFALRRLHVIPGLRVSKTFKWVGIGDTEAYLAWSVPWLRKLSANKLLVSHGEPLELANLGEQLAALNEAVR